MTIPKIDPYPARIYVDPPQTWASSDQKWLTVDKVSNGVVHFSFTKNTGAARTTHLDILGREITVNQGAAS